MPDFESLERAAGSSAFEAMPYAGGDSLVKLHAPSGLTLRLAPEGDTKEIAWAPHKKTAMDLEVRARMVGTTAGLGQIPIVRWSAKIGHGKNVYREPQGAFQQISGTPMLNYSLPARGMLLRLSARELTLAFTLQGPIAGAPIRSVDLAVSIQPCLGSHLPTLPYQHLANPIAGVQQPFPLEAREWRVTDHRGLPFALGVTGILLIGVAGALISVDDASLYADWHPIPHDAASWQVTAGLVYAAYR